METIAQSSNGIHSVHLHGRFTFNDNPEFREAVLDKISTPDITKITLHLERVEFVDSAALGMLLLAHDEAKKHNKQLLIQGVSGQVKRIFDMACFHQFFSY
ncbi:anti-sigma factor antagonist [bacterium]|nr:anti-sigma factor antagonist [bacterium]